MPFRRLFTPPVRSIPSEMLLRDPLSFVRPIALRTGKLSRCDCQTRFSSVWVAGKESIFLCQMRLYPKLQLGAFTGKGTPQSISNDTLARLTGFIHSLKQEKQQRLQKGGGCRQKTVVPAPRLISPSELEEFRPLIRIKRDQDTGKVFQVVDGLLLKDGYVYNKVSPDSLSLWGVVPTEEELLKFGPSENNESNDLEWLSQLYGDKKKKGS